MELTFRTARPEDAGLVLSFIKELSVYEKMADEVTATEELLEKQIFEDHRAEVFFAVLDGKEIGFALFFHNFSTFIGKAGMYLEDFYVKPEYRGRGYGTAIFKEVVRIAAERDCGRMEWSCLDWNQPSIDFYHGMGAVGMDDWTVYRLTEEKIKALATA